MKKFFLLIIQLLKKEQLNEHKVMLNFVKNIFLKFLN